MPAVWHDLGVRGNEEQLSRDRELAAEHGVVFSVVGRPKGQRPGDGPPVHFGEFDGPAEAVQLAASTGDHDLTVVADGTGPYWASNEPGLVRSELLQDVCRRIALRRELSELPDHAQLIDALTRTVAETESWRWLELGCSLVAGRGDHLSDVDVAVGYELGAEEVERAGTELVETIGESQDVLIHAEDDWPDGIVRFAVEYRSGVQLDLVFMPASHRPGLPPATLALVDKDNRLAQSWTPALHDAGARHAREWTMLGWWALSNVAKYVRRGSLYEAIDALHEARTQMLRVHALARGVAYPSFGLTSLLDAEPPELPGGLAVTYATPAQPATILRAAVALADILAKTAWNAGAALGVDLETSWQQVARDRLRAAFGTPSGAEPADAIDVPLTLVDREPHHVVGPRAFVLHQPDIGHVEVGAPPPDHDIWEHQAGDLRYTAVEEAHSGVAGGGGGTWDSDRLDVLGSFPSADSAPWHIGYVVVGLIPRQYVEVLLEHGGRHYRQTPINQTVVFPLPDRERPAVVIRGVDHSGGVTELWRRA